MFLERLVSENQPFLLQRQRYRKEGKIAHHSLDEGIDYQSLAA
jgi:hypothetical protein